VLRLTTAPSFPNQTPSTLHHLFKHAHAKARCVHLHPPPALHWAMSPPERKPVVSIPRFQRTCVLQLHSLALLCSCLGVKLTHSSTSRLSSPSTCRCPPRQDRRPGQEGRGMWTRLASIPAIFSLTPVIPTPLARRLLLAKWHLHLHLCACTSTPDRPASCLRAWCGWL
jgi:hypothetical protein